MNRLALILSIVVPVSATAQFAYPPPPPQTYVAPRPPPLSPFYVNLGIGGGWAGLRDPYGFTTVGGLAYDFEAGARLSPQLLLGFGLTGLTVFADPYGGTTGVTALDYDVVLTLFPFVHGFFLKGGGGLATLSMTPPFAPGFTHTGGNVLLGSGWAIPVAPPLHVTLGLDWTRQFFGSQEITDTSIWMMRVGLGFY